MSGQWQRKRVGQDWAPLGVSGPTLAGSGIQVTQDDNGAEVRYVDRSGVAARYFAAGQPLVIDSEPPPPINPPVVTSHPTNATVDTGSQVSFFASATGDSPITWAWFSSANGTTWNAISGATGTGGIATLTFSASLDDTGLQYRAAFTNPGGTTTTNAATLTVQSASSADYVVTSVAEWDTTMALGGATLSGKVVEIQGSITDVTMANITCSPPVTIRGATGSSLRRMVVNNISGVRFVNVSHQMTGWPAVHREMTDIQGTITNVRWIGCNWRHGYGPNQDDFLVEAYYPEYERIDNVINATTINTTVELQYQDTFENIPRDAWIEFFNRGSVPVHYAIGGSNVVATTSSPVAPANARTRITWPIANTDRPSHIAVITASGESQVNARTEIGLAVYMCDAFKKGNSNANLNNVWWVGCRFEGVDSPLKAPGTPTGRVVVDRCIMGPFYTDAVAFSGLTDNPAIDIWMTRNYLIQSAGKAGINEGDTGHARDVHTDNVIQIYQPNNAAVSQARIRVVGNLYQPGPVRPLTTAQGIWLCPPVTSGGPTYLDDVLIISNVMPFGSVNQIGMGRSGNQCLVRNAIVLNNTIVGRDDLLGGKIFSIQNTSGVFHTLIRNNVARTIDRVVDVVQENNLLWTAGTLGNIFANPEARLVTSGTPEAYADGLALLPQHAGIGFRSDLVDWSAEDGPDCINWHLIDPGVRWRNELGVEKSTLITSDWRRAIGGPSTMTIAPLAGCEYRIANNSAGSGASAWTTASGTLNRGEWVQIRGTSSSNDLTTLPFGATINGQSISFAVKTVGPFFTLNGDMGFKDPAGSASLTGAGGRLTMEFVLQSSSSRAFTMYQHGVQTVTFDVSSNDTIRIAIRDSAGVQVLGQSSVVSANGAYLINALNTILASVDLPGRKFRCWRNGDLILDLDLLENTGAFPSTSVANMLQTNAGGSRHIGQVYGLKLWKGVVSEDGDPPTATPYFEMPGDAATANASPWKQGTGSAS
jgi:hypothetical protein